jgi:uracil-DNA glycosylase
MVLKDIWDIYEGGVFKGRSTEDLFNQYRDRVEGLDLPGAAGIRRRNLRNYLESFPARPGVLVVGEAAGPWGCRFSGIPFTGERQLKSGELPFRGRKSSTHEPPYLERSGTVLWKALLRHHPGFLLWNTVPYHPHTRGEPLDIRTPSRAEIEACSVFLKEVIRLLRPALIVAVGRKAEGAIRALGESPVYVRHPSQAGARAFREGVERVFGKYLKGKGRPSGSKGAVIENPR